MHEYDFIGVGLGPFNLGLAALTEPLDELDGLFLEARDRFDWHPGMMLPDATLQVPFLADLVTMADPTSPFSFLAFLKDTGRLYSFYIRESFYPLRAEYNQYCQWVSDRLTSVRFGEAVERVEHDGSAYVVRTNQGESYRTKRLVLGTGTQPKVPDACAGLGGPAIHTSDYLTRKADLQDTGSITVVGSGQSAAEVYADLLADIESHGYTLSWVTRSPRFFPMEYTKLTLEMTSPEYTAYFQALPGEKRDELLREQRGLYKGISSDTINDIFDTLYAKQVHGGVDTNLLTCAALTGAEWDGTAYTLDLHHTEQHEDLRLRTESLVLATGYASSVPAFLDPVRDRIRWDERGRYDASSTYAVDRAGEEIFVQNGEEHTHGFVAPDLGMGAYRSSVIIAAMVGREVYPIEKRIAFQQFGVPDHLRLMAGAAR
ncbi:lysine N(6)-hydroxylase/L-ornithine N(5)-oxygenase family protein [Luteipulveratus mongoliensis]|uniref:L-lysine N6-monooxygenase MbtG n=1 Tax=Luteipulveratus mongoliensis TaxID=571913 RepID=A0A0K1JJE4_9MICO|nr:SidA/IucD/PvdA family monooxygenase [Luteipulveratus mongoliensis]AKU16849.1 alcaligin biosynthesis protein [Luteipulveratus mongoliensis]